MLMTRLMTITAICTSLDDDKEDESNQNIQTSLPPSPTAVNTLSIGSKRQSDNSETPRETKKRRSKVTGREKWVKTKDKKLLMLRQHF